jgi:prefoldin subunit 5
MVKEMLENQKTFTMQSIEDKNAYIDGLKNTIEDARKELEILKTREKEITIAIKVLEEAE